MRTALATALVLAAALLVGVPQGVKAADPLDKAQLEGMKRDTIEKLKQQIAKREKEKSAKGGLEPMPIDKKGWCREKCADLAQSQCWAYEPEDWYADDCHDPIFDHCFDWCTGR